MLGRLLGHLHLALALPAGRHLLDQLLHVPDADDGKVLGQLLLLLEGLEHEVGLGMLWPTCLVGPVQYHLDRDVAGGLGGDEGVEDADQLLDLLTSSGRPESIIWL